jgi:aerobic C4-dicarboxylate transport protein
MKIWVKYIIAAVIGILLMPLVQFFVGLFAPDFDQWSEVLDHVFPFILGIGKLILLPMVFFSIGIAVDSLRMDQKLWSVSWKGLVYALATAGILAILGSLVLLIFRPSYFQPNDITLAQILASETMNEFAENSFNLNGIWTFLISESGLLPVYFFGFFLGMHFHFNHEISRPTMNLFDSLSQVLYHANSFLVEILPLGMVALAAHWAFQAGNIERFGQYVPFLLAVIFTALVIIFGVIPLALFLFAKERRPYRVIYALIAPAIMAFFSGDPLFAYGSLTKHTKENLGLRRKAGSSLGPYWLLLGRAGTAMITLMTFYYIRMSQTQFPITPLEVFGALGLSLILPLVLPFRLTLYPQLAITTGLLFMLGENEINIIGYAAPILPILMSIGALLDTLIAGAGSYLIGKNVGLTRKISSRNFILARISHEWP